MKEEQPYLLAIDCSGRIGSAAVGRGETLLAEKVFTGAMRHSRELFGSMDDVLCQAGCSLQEIRAFCFTKGPGSFTGLRIAVSTAKMLNFSRGIPLVSVNTLDAIAVNTIDYIENLAEPPTYLAVVLDAKKNHFFSAVYQYESKKWRKCVDDMLISSQDLLARLCSFQRLAVVGEGLLYHKNLFLSAGIQVFPEELWPARGKGILSLSYPKFLAGDFEDPIQLVPYYIRPPEITEKTQKKA